jgi:hypothetical protein
MTIHADFLILMASERPGGFSFRECRPEHPEAPSTKKGPLFLRECPKGSFCSKLLPEAKLFAGEDHIPQKEITTSPQLSPRSDSLPLIHLKKKKNRSYRFEVCPGPI